MRTKGANKKFVLNAGDAEQCLVLILVVDSNLHVGHGHVELGEVARPSGLINTLIQMRQRLHGLPSNGVELTEFLTEAPRPVRRRLPSKDCKTMEAACQALGGTIHP
jgi:hypothetical protein